MKGLRLLAIAGMLAGLSSSCGMDGSDPTTGGGFSNKDDDAQTTRVRGQALGEENDQPVAGATVYLRYADQPGQTTQTGEDGRFQFDEVPAGQAKLVINDGNGVGALRSVTLFGDGQNEFGPIHLQPLENVTGIVDVHGVGFEQRVTTAAGNYKYPAFSSDASTLFAARKLDGAHQWSIVEVDTATGQEQVLLDHESILDWRDAPLKVLADRYLLVERDLDDGMALVIYDTQDDEIVFDSTDVSEFHGSIHPVITDDAAFFEIEMDVQHLPNAFRFSNRASRTRIFRFDAATQQVDRGPVIGNAWTLNTGIQANGDVVAAQAYSACHNAAGALVACSADASNDGPIDQAEEPVDQKMISAWAMDPDTLEARRIYEVDTWGSHSVAMPAHGHLVYGTYSDGSGQLRVVQLTPDSGSSTTNTVDIPDGESRPHVYAGADGQSLLLATPQQGDHRLDGTHFEMWDFDSGARQQIGTEVTIDEGNVDMCQHGQCWSTILDDGTVRISNDFAAPSGNHWSAIIDWKDGQRVSTRTFDIWEDGDEAGDFDPTVYSTPGSDVDVVRLRDADTGFYQLWLQESDGDFEQTSFLTAAHHDVRVSPDGSTVFYLTRDPISGFEQLFEMDLSSLPNR